MKAKILELSGKYYGTEIEVIFNSGEETTFEVWHSTGVPSERSLSELGCTIDDWKSNKSIDDGWGGKCSVREMICDSHYESQETYELCKFIVDCINAKDEVL